MWEEDEEALHVDVELVRGKVIREAGAGIMHLSDFIISMKSIQ